MSLKRTPCSMLSLAIVFLSGLFIVPGVATSAVRSCPFCAAPSLTLAEQLSQADAAALVMWAEAKKARQVKGTVSYTHLTLPTTPYV